MSVFQYSNKMYTRVNLEDKVSKVVLLCYSNAFDQLSHYQELDIISVIDKILLSAQNSIDESLNPVDIKFDQQGSYKK